MSDASGATGAQRGDRLLRERVHDPYKTRLKLPDDTVCPQCGAVFRKGRWTWGDAKSDSAGREMCQACRRINDDYPAGIVALSGGFLAGHRDEILNLARRQEELEKGEHPLHRIMSIDDGDEVVIKTTDIHLPRRIGQAIERAYGGSFDFSYDDAGYFLRGSWHRD